MIQILPCAERLEELIRFVARLNSDGTHHIGFFFIGTDSAARGRGIGAELLAAGEDWMLSAPTTRRIHLTVNTDNVAARSLYERFGFITERIMRGYRKQVA